MLVCLGFSSCNTSNSGFISSSIVMYSSYLESEHKFSHQLVLRSEQQRIPSLLPDPEETDKFSPNLNYVGLSHFILMFPGLVKVLKL